MAVKQGVYRHYSQKPKRRDVRGTYWRIGCVAESACRDSVTRFIRLAIHGRQC